MIIIWYDIVIIVKGLVNMYKAFKFRIYPNAPQKSFINKSLGCSRFIYNYYLSMLKDNGYMNANACIKDYVDNLKYEYSFLTEVDSIIIRKSKDSLKNKVNILYLKVSLVKTLIILLLYMVVIKVKSIVILR